MGYDDQFNLYTYVGNDPLKGTDPRGMDQVCAFGDDRRFRSCVETGETLSGGEERKLEESYRGYILTHDGEDVSGDGKTVVGDGDVVSEQAIKNVRIASKFVGAVIRHHGDERDKAAWKEVRIIGFADQALVKDALGETHINPDKTAFGAVYLNKWYRSDFEANFTKTALLIIHEALHFNEDFITSFGGVMGASRNQHQLLHYRAQFLTHGAGLGGCVSLGIYPACRNPVYVGP